MLEELEVASKADCLVSQHTTINNDKSALQLRRGVFDFLCASMYVLESGGYLPSNLSIRISCATSTVSHVNYTRRCEGFSQFFILATCFIYIYSDYFSTFSLYTPLIISRVYILCAKAQYIHAYIGKTT